MRDVATLLAPIRAALAAGPTPGPGAADPRGVMMTFDEWMHRDTGGKYRPTDDGVQTRLLRRCWGAAVVAERERCAALCEDEARVREDSAQKTHGKGSPAYGRQMAGVNAARNCAKAIRGA